jgi:hypothetical protein
MPADDASVEALTAFEDGLPVRLLKIAGTIYTYWTQKNFTEDMRL